MNEEFNHFRNCTIYSANCLSHNITTLFIISFDITLTLPYQRILLNHLVERAMDIYVYIRLKDMFYIWITIVINMPTRL